MAPVIKAHKADTLVSWTIPSIYQYQISFKYLKIENGQKQQQKKLIYKCITANTSAIWQHAAHTTNELTSPSC